MIKDLPENRVEDIAVAVALEKESAKPNYGMYTSSILKKRL